MFQDIMIFVAMTVIGAALIHIASQPTWQGHCAPERCIVEIGVS